MTLVFVRFVLRLALFAAYLGPMLAGTVSPFEQAVEALMDAQGANASLVGRAFGADQSAVLSFTSDVDALGTTFSYSLASGSRYQAQPITSEGTGALDPVTGLWTMSSSGSLGDATWTGAGSGSFTGDPSFSFRWDWVLISGGTRGFLDYVSVGKLVVVNGGPESEELVTYTILGSPVGVSAGHDIIRLPDWSWDLGGNINVGISVAAAGIQPAAGGAGFFTDRILPVPEASSLMMVISGVGLLNLLKKWPRRMTQNLPFLVRFRAIRTEIAKIARTKVDGSGTAVVKDCPSNVTVSGST